LILKIVIGTIILLYEFNKKNKSQNSYLNSEFKFKFFKKTFDLKICISIVNTAILILLKKLFEFET